MGPGGGGRASGAVQHHRPPPLRRIGRRGRPGGALAHLVDRHEILRTGVVVESGRPWQRVAPAASVEFSTTDLSDTPGPEREEELRRRIAEEDAGPFELSRPPLIRAHLFRLGDALSQLTVTLDHLVADGAASSVFMRELGTAYWALVAGRVPELPPLPIRFADFAVWQREWVTESNRYSAGSWTGGRRCSRGCRSGRRCRSTASRRRRRDASPHGRSHSEPELVASSRGRREMRGARCSSLPWQACRRRSAAKVGPPMSWSAPP